MIFFFFIKVFHPCEFTLKRVKNDVCFQGPTSETKQIKRGHFIFPHANC